MRSVSRESKILFVSFRTRIHVANLGQLLAWAAGLILGLPWLLGCHGRQVNSELRIKSDFIDNPFANPDTPNPVQFSLPYLAPNPRLQIRIRIRIRRIP